MADTAVPDDDEHDPDAGRSAALMWFRFGLRECLSRWGHALFELADATICATRPVTSVPALNLEPEFRRSHGSL